MNPQRLIDARKAKKLSQREVGEALEGTSKGRARIKISEYERGVLSPPYDVACQLAAILNVPTCYFYINNEDDIFAEQVLMLYRNNFGNGFEKELITTLTKKSREYEKSFDDLKNTLEDFKKTMEHINLVRKGDPTIKSHDD
ncbi:helix-turn-helix domain-containing protein (plasmid) [Xenorhabdus stockiae]|uniref:helix-turn-helix domain-containing protein n=1 Tax=Xenorhabdus stockiae TaxID=351614 RepID=UPI003CF08E15